MNNADWHHCGHSHVTIDHVREWPVASVVFEETIYRCLSCGHKLYKRELPRGVSITVMYAQEGVAATDTNGYADGEIWRFGELDGDKPLWSARICNGGSDIGILFSHSDTMTIMLTRREMAALLPFIQEWLAARQPDAPGRE